MINLICSLAGGCNKENPADAESDNCFRELLSFPSVERNPLERGEGENKESSRADASVSERIGRKKRSLAITYRGTQFGVIYTRSMIRGSVGVDFLGIAWKSIYRERAPVPLINRLRSRGFIPFFLNGSEILARRDYFGTVKYAMAV